MVNEKYELKEVTAYKLTVQPGNSGDHKLLDKGLFRSAEEARAALADYFRAPEFYERVGNSRKVGRPKGSKNKPKPSGELVKEVNEG